MTRPRILIITRNLPPLVGGMERLNWHMADELAKQADVVVVGPKDAMALKPENTRLTEAPLKPLSIFLVVAALKGLWSIILRKPDIILAGSGLTAPITWVLAKLSGARSVAYLHGLDITTNHSLYRKLWRPTFKNLDKVIVNSTPTRDLAIAAGINPSNIDMVHPGVILPESRQTEENISDFKAKHELTDKKILLSVGRLTTRKGLREFIEHSLPSIVDSIPNTVLTIVGEAPKNSLNAEAQTQESILAQADKFGVSSHIKFLGSITNDSLITAYEAADVHIFPVRHISKDPEGFGMVAIEAAAHGLPTVTFATGGTIDSVDNGASGYLVECGNYQKFSRQVIQLLKQPMATDGIQEFSLAFSWHKFGEHIWTSLEAPRNHTPERQAHVVTDLPSRILKAKKIELLLDLDKIDKKTPHRILEVGCGSGGISHYFGTHPQLQCDVTSIDIHDSRRVKEGYKFKKVKDVGIPLPSASFDIVISNHVIEHVGEKGEQLKHLKEIRRVLAPSGQCYLAVPNRWMVTEPHYKLKFLSWLPHNMRTRYLRWSGKGEFYDCEPLEPAQLERLATLARMSFENKSVSATKVTLELEQPNSLATKLIRKLPDTILKPFKPIIPTLIYRLAPKNE